MNYTEEEISKIYQLLFSEDDVNVILALQLLTEVDLPEEMVVALLWLSYYLPNHLTEPILLLTKQKINPEKHQQIYSALKLFTVVHDAYRFHSEHTYNTSEEKLLEFLHFYPTISQSVQQLIKSHPRFRSEFAQIAQAIWTYYRLPEAESFLLQLIDNQINVSFNHFYLGQLYQQSLKKYDLAIEHYQKFIALEPAILFDNEFIIDEWFVQYRHYPPSTTEALLELGNIYFQELKNYPLAKKKYTQAIDLQSISHIAPYEQLAEIYEKQENNLKKALELRLKINEIKAQSSIYRYKNQALINFSQSIFQIGNDYLELLKDHKQAMMCYKKALNIQPKNIDIMLKQADLAVEFYKDYWQARALYEKILKIQPQQTEIKQKLQKIQEIIQGK